MSALGDDLRRMIMLDGPMTVERFMALALGHPRHGYYMTRDPFGGAGDFTTAPEISQMFGELLGLWAAEVWHAMGRPDPVRLIELGPGRGTLMADAVRAARALPAFRTSLDIHMVETSPVLRSVQEGSLGRAGVEATWHATTETVPDGPAIILANEFFDALPIRQFVRQAGGLYERLVGLDPEGRLAFGLAPEPVRERAPPGRSPGDMGSVFERAEVAFSVMGAVARRLVAEGGALLAIDYGSDGDGPTLQAVKRHRFADPLAEPGEADLTAHVDFANLGRAAVRGGAVVHGPVPQGLFLRRLGLAERAERLGRSASPAQAASLEAAVARLAGPNPGMGNLFKAFAVTSPGLPRPPGFAESPS